MASATIPTNLPPRYEIRVLGPEHSVWVRALVSHTNMFHSPIWPVIYPEHKTRRAYAGFREVAYLVNHQINSGYSLGVFDTEYVFKRPESAATSGALYWDLEDESADEDKLLEQMDFPLVSVALAFDGFHALDPEKMKPMIELMPGFAQIYGFLVQSDKRDPETWKAKAEGELLLRNATCTRRDYERKGLMRKAAEYMMRVAAAKGFQAIQIDTSQDGVHKVWSEPPPPFKAEVVCDFNTSTAELEDENGQKIFPLQPAEQRITRIWVSLK
jgi:hypothetical protein